MTDTEIKIEYSEPRRVTLTMTVDTNINYLYLFQQTFQSNVGISSPFAIACNEPKIIILDFLLSIGDCSIIEANSMGRAKPGLSLHQQFIARSHFVLKKNRTPFSFLS